MKIFTIYSTDVIINGSVLSLEENRVYKYDTPASYYSIGLGCGVVLDCGYEK
jgi:hypothetical protein